MSIKVSDAMHRGCTWVSTDISLDEVAKIMMDEDIGILVVMENDRLAGIVTDRDIVVRGVARGGVSSVRDVMTEGVAFCGQDDALEDAVQKMMENQFRRLVVVDAQDRPVGVLSVGDVSHGGDENLTVELMQAVSAHHG